MWCFVFDGCPCSPSPASSDTSTPKLRAHLPPVSLETRHNKSTVWATQLSREGRLSSSFITIFAKLSRKIALHKLQKIMYFQSYLTTFAKLANKKLSQIQVLPFAKGHFGIPKVIAYYTQDKDLLSSTNTIST